MILSSNFDSSVLKVPVHGNQFSSPLADYSTHSGAEAAIYFDAVGILFWPVRSFSITKSC